VELASFSHDGLEELSGKSNIQSAIYGVYGGTFVDPNWFDRSPEMTRHIFLDSELVTKNDLMVAYCVRF
jgi:hypothetical protein